jgi:Fungal specific transcription factor domain
VQSLPDPRSNLGIIAPNDHDSAHFEYFANICTKEFSLYFESPVWEGIVLQTACTEPCIRHAALAIGALSRNNYNHHNQSSQPAAREYSMKQYNLALRTLNQTLDRKTGSWELAVLASIVFIAFEVLWGLDTKVRMHIDAAVAIFATGTRRVSSNSKTDLGYLVSALSQLGAQFSSFGGLQSESWSEGSIVHAKL